MWLRYRWYAASGEPSGAWRGLYHPSTGGVEEGVSSTPTTPTNGYLKVNTDGADGQWSVDDGVTWHESGTTLTLAPGSYTVTYQPVAGYVTPAPAVVTIITGQVTTIAGDYVAEVIDPYEDWGYLRVTLTGTDAGRWTIDSGDTWHESGVTLYVLAGSYGVQFEPVNGYTTPIEQIVTVSAGQTTSVSAGYVAVDVSHDPTDYGMVWDNGTEPTLAEGAKVIYVTPTGAGSNDGSSWANAKAGIYLAQLEANDGDVLYLQEGNYTNHLAPLSSSKSIAVYGGFTVEDGTWATRNGWTHRSIIDATSNPNIAFAQPAADENQIIDGLCFTGFGTGGVVAGANGSSTLKNCILYGCTGGTTMVVSDMDNTLAVSCTGSTTLTTGTINDCVFQSCIASINIANTSSSTDNKFYNCSTTHPTVAQEPSILKCSSAVSGCYFDGCTSAYGMVTGSSAVSDCYFDKCTITGSDVNYYHTSIISIGTDGVIDGCSFIDCSVTLSLITGNLNTVIDCEFTECNGRIGATTSASALTTTISACDFTNCSTFVNSGYNTIVNDCNFTDCVPTGNTDLVRVFDGAASGLYLNVNRCSFVNCQGSSILNLYYAKSANLLKATNCEFINCSGRLTSAEQSYGGIDYSLMQFCSVIRCNFTKCSENAVSSLVWGGVTTAPWRVTNKCATQVYLNEDSLVLGNDNSMSKFGDPGEITTVGYSASLKGLTRTDFGNFRPITGSLLIGAGAGVYGVTTDITGATRSNPPTIGAYEVPND